MTGDRGSGHRASGFTEAENHRILDLLEARHGEAAIALALQRHGWEIEAQIARLRRHGVARCSTRRGSA